MNGYEVLYKKITNSEFEDGIGTFLERVTRNLVAVYIMEAFVC